MSFALFYQLFIYIYFFFLLVYLHYYYSLFKSIYLFLYIIITMSRCACNKRILSYLIIAQCMGKGGLGSRSMSKHNANDNNTN